MGTCRDDLRVQYSYQNENQCSIKCYDSTISYHVERLVSCYLAVVFVIVVAVAAILYFKAFSLGNAHFNIIYLKETQFTDFSFNCEMSAFQGSSNLFSSKNVMCL